MAADINTVTLVGRLARDAELKSTGTTPVLRIRLAFTSSRKVGDGWEDAPNYVDVVTFGRQAETLSPMMHKGDRIGVTGRLSWREWESDNGKRQTIEVVADRVQLLTPKGDRPQAVAAAPVVPVPTSTDDIPF